ELLALIKQDVLSQGLGAATDDQGNRIIMEISQERYYLDDSREWVVSYETTQHINDETRVETVLNMRLARAYLWSPKLPPLVFEVHAPRKGEPCIGIDVVRCRKNGLANARFPLPVFCTLDDVVAARPGHLADLTYVSLRTDGRATTFSQLPYVGEGWYAKPITAFLLEAGMATWEDFKYSLDATAHAQPECFRKALNVMEGAWPADEEHYAKLSVNALIGLWARNMDLVYTMRTSQNEIDGFGCQERRVFSVYPPTSTDPVAEDEVPVAQYWDYIWIRHLTSNSSHRPLHDFVLASEYVAVARIKHHMRAALSSCFKCIKTDCVVAQRIPKKHQHLLQELQDLRHPDGSSVYRVEDVKPLKGLFREPRLADHVVPPELQWTDIPDPLTHCLAGGSLLLTGLPRTGKTYLARRIVAALREQGQAVHLVAKTHCAAQNMGQGARTADHWLRKYVRHGNVRSIDWLVVEEITQLGTALWNDIACLALNTRIRFLLLGDFRQLPAVLDSFAGAEVQRELQQAQLIKTLTRGYRHELVENRRSDQVIFDFLRWLRIDEPEEAPLISALRGLGAVPRATHYARHGLGDQSPPPHAAERAGEPRQGPGRRRALRVHWSHRSQEPDQRATEHAHLAGPPPRGRGRQDLQGNVRDGAVELEDGMQLKRHELFKHTRLPHAITYASCQGLTLSGHVALCDTSNKHFTLRHLYVGSSRAAWPRSCGWRAGLRKKAMRLLELFSGTKSIGRAFEARGWEVVSVDLNPKFEPTICCDVTELDETALGRFDMVWASPVCTEYSIALTKRPRDLDAGDRLVLRALEIIRNLRPTYWAIENPQTGLLKTRPFMQGLPYSDVCYCKYGYMYRKATRIWHNLPWTPSQGMCRKGSRCEAFANGIHPEAAQRETTAGRRNQQSLRQLYSLPPRLCEEIAAAASG
ncbi:unnamed protein product, partial [Symbiodinium necroappetens]